MKYTTAIITLFILISLSISAQVDSVSISTDKVEVVKRYEAAILQARRKKISFELEENNRPPITYNYNVTTEKVIDFERPDPEIRALGYKGDPVSNQDLKDGYIYGAYGTHNTINAGAAFHYYIEDWLDAGLRIDHISASQEGDLLDLAAELPVDILSQTAADLYFGYNLGTQSRLTLKGESQFVRHNNPPLFFSNLDWSIPINKYGADIGFEHNVFEDKSFVLRLDGKYDHAIHLRDTSWTDNIFEADLNVFKTFNDTWSFELPINYANTKVKPLETSVSDLIVEPNVRFKGQNYTAKVGVQYITGDEASYIFPLIDLSLPAIFAGIDLRLYTESQYFRNSFYNISDINPYFFATTSDYSPNYMRSYNLDFNYDLSQFDFGLGVSYMQYENTTNFIERGPRRGVATYLDRDQFTIRPSISYNFEENVRFKLDGQYNIFLEDLRLTYLSKFVLQFTGEQLLFNDKLVLNQGLIFNSSRNVLSADMLFERDSFWDLSFKATYRISPSFEIFARGTNLLGERYDVWHSQFVFEKQIWGGLKFRF